MSRCGISCPPDRITRPHERWPVLYLLHGCCDIHPLRQAHVPVTTYFYGPGTHSWPYWQRDQHRSFPMLMQAIGAQPASAGQAAAH
jgi:hypothetical protein